MTTTIRRTTPLVARTRTPAPPDIPTPPPPARDEEAPAEVPREVPRRTAASVGWWGLLLVAASLGVVALIGTSTFERVGRRDSALRALTAGLQQPTETLLIKELSRPDSGTRVSARADLVAFDIDRAAALADPQAAARAAAESRAAELYDRGLPPDPGPSRTEIGISRSILGVMSQANHDKVARARIAAAIMALALLVLCFVQTRDDNMLVLPGCAVVGGWILASAAKFLVAELIGNVNGASDTYVRSFEAAAAQPLSIARTAALGLLAGGAIYRFITLARNFRESRRVSAYSTQ